MNIALIPDFNSCSLPDSYCSTARYNPL